jgi:hypothetical protein
MMINDKIKELQTLIIQKRGIKNMNVKLYQFIKLDNG